MTALFVILGALVFIMLAGLLAIVALCVVGGMVAERLDDEWDSNFPLSAADNQLDTDPSRYGISQYSGTDVVPQSGQLLQYKVKNA